MPDPITKFSGRYGFLSNFYKTTILVDGLSYPTMEHAFQALKTSNPDERYAIRQSATPTDAKRLGRRVELREDWEEVKSLIMYHLLRHQKFNPMLHPKLAWKLIDTYPRKLYEGNTWGDRYWGCDPVTLEGKNMLGFILEETRDHIWEMTQIMAPRKQGLPIRKAGDDPPAAPGPY